MSIKNHTPPKNAKRIYRWADLPNTIEAASYLVEEPGLEPRAITVAKHKRQVLEGLLNGPMFTASYCRLSDQVLPLRRDEGLTIRCDMYANDPEIGRERYGIYVLESVVTRLHDERVAA